ncbi:MAG: methyltransferase domain-containing protein [Patescibacteria group bacterium]
MDKSSIFYDKFAQSYSEYSKQKAIYLSAVNKYIIANADKKASNLIDIGCGDGFRVKNIAASLKIKNIFLLDNSVAMLSLCNKLHNAEIIPQDISDKNFNLNKKFDIVLCLWNVVGHIIEPDARKRALKNIYKMMNNDSVLYIDVNNRYNIISYGLVSVIKNIIMDLFFFAHMTGDFDLRIEKEGYFISTKVHIFNPFEIEKIFKEAGLKIIDRKIIDYSTGEQKFSIFSGQLVYKLKINL